MIATLMLSPLIADSSTEEKSYKQGMVEVSGPCYVKMVFALLTKVIAIHVQFFIV